ncbi:hypothetical protein BC940DRAFT_306417 [Gongronella butleri]|nr:hypothetical protein BC940DRAFT_306417 [Gongronella butleri]
MNLFLLLSWVGAARGRRRLPLYAQHSFKSGLPGLFGKSPITEGDQKSPTRPGAAHCACRALVKESALIVLDEATSSDDFDTDRCLQRTIPAEFKNLALICIAHIGLRTIFDYYRVSRA